MSITKRICGIVLCVLLLAGCATSQQAVQTTAPQVAQVTKNYKTVEVTRGTFTMSSTLNGKVNSETHEYVYCEHEGGILKERIAVKRGDTVKKGDLIATITYETSDAQLARLELAYEHAVESMESGISNYYQRIASIEGDDRLSYLQRMQVEYELGSYKVSANRQCERALEALEEYKDRYTEKQILAPADGLVFAVGSLQVGEIVPEGTLMVELVDTSTPCIQVQAPEQAYMMSTLGIKGSGTFREESYSGQITGTPNVITSYNATGVNEMINISVDSCPITEYEVGITLKILELENMLMLPEAAIQDGGYVMVLEDGVQVKRKIVQGPTGDGGMVCILDGLTEGQLVVLE